MPYWVTLRDPATGLHERLSDGSLTESDALAVLGAVADALAVLHRFGVRHGALDASRVRSDSERVTLTGFALSVAAHVWYVDVFATKDGHGVAKFVVPWVAALLVALVGTSRVADPD